jgi:hypothetical protein
LYYEWPELEEAYRYRGEYLFGDDLLVAPVTKPTSPISGCAQARVWLPPGEWTYWFSGRTFTGPGLIALQLPLDEIPLFVRGGAIIPMQPKMNRTGEKPVDPLILHIWPGDSGSARVYEDDGETTGYQRNECTWTPVAHKLIEGVRHITIGPAEGQFPGMLERRRYEVRLRDLQPPGKITVNGLEALREFTVSGTVIIGKEPPDAPWWSDEEQDTIIHLPAQPPDQKVEAIIEYAVPAPLQEFPQGLRGRFRIMSELLNRAATKSPEIHQKFMRRFEEAVRERDSNKGVDVALVETVNEATDVALVDTLLEAELDPVTMRRALARLLNACAELEVSARAENNINLAIHVSAASIDGAKVASEVTLHATPHWRTVGEQRWAITELKSYEPVTVTTPLRAEQWPQTAVIGGNIVFRTDKLTLDVPLEQVVLPSVNRWWIIGPFDAESKEGLEKVFPPEETIDLAATYEGKAGRKIGWQKVERRITPSTDLIEEFFVKLSDVFGRYETNAVCYALTYLHAPEDTDAVLAFGTDDGVVVWLNGTEVYRLQVGRPYRSKEDRLPIRLSQGSNALLLKVSQSGGDWGFCVHVETPDGQPLTAVTAHLTP